MARRDASLTDLLGELKELVVGYARQETVEPIKNLGRFVAFGIAGSIFVGIGLSLGVLSLLRALQTETGTRFDGDWTWAPYAIVAGACLILMGVAVAAATRGGRS